MRRLVLIFAIVACVMTLAWTAAVEQLESENLAATSLLDVDSTVDQSDTEGGRQVRQFYGGFYRPYGYYQPYYYRPYYGYGYYRPYYGYYRPYYGGFGYYG